jgi:hypothetical protein
MLIGQLHRAYNCLRLLYATTYWAALGGQTQHVPLNFGSSAHKPAPPMIFSLVVCCSSILPVSLLKALEPFFFHILHPISQELAGQVFKTHPESNPAYHLHCYHCYHRVAVTSCFGHCNSLLSSLPAFYPFSLNFMQEEWPFKKVSQIMSLLHSKSCNSSLYSESMPMSLQWPIWPSVIDLSPTITLTLSLTGLPHFSLCSIYTELLAVF